MLMESEQSHQIKKIKSELNSKILRFLSYKPRTVSEIEVASRKYLKKYDFELCEIESLISEAILPLQKAGYLDDVDYAYSYILEQQQRDSPRGPSYISRFLGRKGISRELIKQSLEKNFPIEKEELCIHKLISKRENIPQPKLINYLLRRGFNKGLVCHLVDTTYKNH